MFKMLLPNITTVDLNKFIDIKVVLHMENNSCTPHVGICKKSEVATAEY